MDKKTVSIAVAGCVPSFTRLHLAVFTNSLTEVETCLEEDPELAMVSSPMTAIALAAFMGHTECVELLLDADPECAVTTCTFPQLSEQNAMTLAEISDHDDILVLLLDAVEEDPASEEEEDSDMDSLFSVEEDEDSIG